MALERDTQPYPTPLRGLPIRKEYSYKEKWIYGPIAQRQSRGLIIPWLQVRILLGPLSSSALIGSRASSNVHAAKGGAQAAATAIVSSAKNPLPFSRDRKRCTDEILAPSPPSRATAPDFHRYIFSALDRRFAPNLDQRRRHVGSVLETRSADPRLRSQRAVHVRGIDPRS